MESRKGGVSSLFLLFLLFLGLKLTGSIDWSWWFITAPLWGGAALAFGFAVIGAALAGIAALVVLAVKSIKK